MPPSIPDDSPVFQLKVTLRNSKPPIWRRIQVRGSTSLYKLHAVLQIAMGWTNSHLHEFTVGYTHYGTPDPVWGRDVKSERRVRLGEIVSGAKDRFNYEYDFGDGWQHIIVVEKVLPPEPGVRYPRCLKGKGACPPEDVGGLWGYYDLLEILNDPKRVEHERLLEWVGGPFDPDEFDLDAVNEWLKTV